MQAAKITDAKPTKTRKTRKTTKPPKLSFEALGRLRDQLVSANGKRRKRVLDWDAVQRAVDRVVNGAPEAWCHGGTVARAYDWEAVTTCCHVARIDGCIYAKVFLMDAKDGGHLTFQGDGRKFRTPESRQAESDRLRRQWAANHATKLNA